jgi:phage tail sheath protein FI
MPVALTYPGVYIEEVPSGVRTITGVATSITAFVGRALRGPVNVPTPVFSFAQFERTFGGLWNLSPLSFAVQHYFLNGGSQALIVRVHNAAPTAAVSLALDGGAVGNLVLNAANPGAWGDKLAVTVDYGPSGSPLAAPQFNLTVTDTGTGAKEVFFNVSSNPASPRFVQQVLAQGSALVVAPTVPTTRPAQAANVDFTIAATPDGNDITAAQVVSGASLATNKEGIFALEKADLFNILCIPPYSPDDDVDAADLPNAFSYCKSRRAILLIDPPGATDTVSEAQTFMNGLTKDENAAFFFPRVLAPNPLRENKVETYAPCGAVAGVLARTDATRGVWKSAAGIDTQLVGVLGLATKLTDNENGLLNPLGINCLRDFPVYGRVVWGSRTLKGADQLASEWKYLAVRRMALFLEESLYRGTQWVVFEPNDEPLWAQIRLNISAFMQNLFRQGAFQGTSPREAYFVKCDKETTTQTDINLGIVNIIVGFAPLKPAEFVVIKLQQIAGNIPT